MSRPKRESAAGPETPAQRIDSAMKLSHGTMPVCVVFKSEAEAEEARKLLERVSKRGKAKQLLTVKVEGAKNG